MGLQGNPIQYDENDLIHSSMCSLVQLANFHMTEAQFRHVFRRPYSKLEDALTKLSFEFITT